jgi:ubiquinone/menaquinone biosynthesis C-methylase UbiE
MTEDFNPSSSAFHRQFNSGLISQLSSKVSLIVRKKMFSAFQEEFPDPKSVLDVGVTSESVAPEANYFEEMFVHKERITACGIEDASDLQNRYPGLKFVRVHSGQDLPFSARSFEVVFCNAVLEHLVNRAEKLHFLRELVRVSDNLFLTVPCRWFPIEHHTGVPLLHMVHSKLFFYFLRLLGRDQFYNSTNLSFLSESDLYSLAQELGVAFNIRRVGFAGFTSNYLLVVHGSKH